MSLDPCPSSPNCVCTQEDPTDAQHYIEPISYAGSASEADDRLDAVFVSRIFRFKDDVSFVVDTASGKIHFRSASRTGHSDLGVNRKRMNALVPQIKALL